MRARQAWRGVSRELDALVAGTPPERDRYLDFLRVFAIAVVVLWHWALSVLFWSGDRWVMPNPIHAVPGSWLATWLLQIVTVFFLVGGYANGAAWWSAQRDGRGLKGYYAARMRRLLVPIGVFLGFWSAFEAVAHLLVPGYLGVHRYAVILFTPLWFIAAYVWVVLLVPLTATAHARARWLTAGLLLAGVGALDAGRFAGGFAALGWLNTALVWVLIHQLGYFYRDFSLAGTLARWGRRAGGGLAAGGLVVLAVLTSLDAYPRSMVTTVGQERSNLLPTTLAVAVISLLQLGVILLLREPVARWLRRPRVWKLVVAANSVVLTVFLWHMTALLVVLGLLRAFDVRLLTEPTAAWWLQRPLWVIGPAAALAVLVAIFGRFELRGGPRAGVNAGG